MNNVEVSRSAMIGVAFSGIVLSLVTSGWALVESLDDDQERAAVEQRLVCLELPGPNDCGLDGR